MNIDREFPIFPLHGFFFCKNNAWSNNIPKMIKFYKKKLCLGLVGKALKLRLNSSPTTKFYLLLPYIILIRLIRNP